MKNRAVISTHHKTGTVWMASVFKAIGEAFDIPFAVYKPSYANSVPAPPVIVQDSHGKWYARPRYHQPDDRVLHVIRDPRDVIISAMHYHLTAEETWLHQPKPDFADKTYQECLKALPDDHARYVFEMDHNAGNVTRAMANWDAKPNCFEAKYEALMADTEGKLFTGILEHLGFDADQLETCRAIFWKHSLFGGNTVKPWKRAHVRDGSARQWPQVFTRPLAEAFLERHGGTLAALGYEADDDSWVGRLGQS